MKLYIDTSNSKNIRLKVGKKEFKHRAKSNKSQELLNFIDNILKKNGIALNKITEIEINPGPGSYTGLRVGVSVANTLAYTLGVPVNGKYVRKGEFIEIKY